MRWLAGSWIGKWSARNGAVMRSFDQIMVECVWPPQTCACRSGATSAHRHRKGVTPVLHLIRYEMDVACLVAGFFGGRVESIEFLGPHQTRQSDQRSICTHYGTCQSKMTQASRSSSRPLCSSQRRSVNVARWLSCDECKS